MVGPSFTSSTSLIAPNSPVSTVQPRSRSICDEGVVQRFGDRSGRGGEEAGTSAGARVAVQSELRDHEHRATDVGEREIHLAGVIGEDAEPGDLVGHPDELRLGIGLREPDQQTVADTDLSDDASVDADFGA